MDEIEKAAMLNCFWVDGANLEANDSGPGTRDKPFKSLAHTLVVARRGIDLVVVVPQDNYSTKHMKYLPEGMTDQECETRIRAILPSF